MVCPSGSLEVEPPASSRMADKLWSTLRSKSQQGLPLHTLGAIDPVQVGGVPYEIPWVLPLKNMIQVTQMARAGIEALYVSGWACSR